MAREDWTDRDDRRREYERDRRRLDDFGQADYSTDYAYDPERRTGYRTDSRYVRDDYDDAAYVRDEAPGDLDRRRLDRPLEDDAYARRLDEGDYRRAERRDGERAEGRSWMERAGDFFAGGTAARAYDRDRDDRQDERDREREMRAHEQRRRRRGPSDRVLWAVISERLEDERRLDLSDVDVLVEDGEVTLNGTVRRKEDKRRIEDIADIDGVDHVQNNLRVRHRDRGWTFI